jgi:DNA-binding YbaB/EbfC family protein
MKGAGGLQQLMRQANQMQNRMKKLQEELAEREYETSSGGGAVSVKLKGETTITKIQISPEVVQSNDVEMLQDLIMTAVNEALKVAKATGASEMEKITGGMNMPGLF